MRNYLGIDNGALSNNGRWSRSRNNQLRSYCGAKSALLQHARSSRNSSCEQGQQPKLGDGSASTIAISHTMTGLGIGLQYRVIIAESFSRRNAYFDYLLAIEH